MEKINSTTDSFKGFHSELQFTTWKAAKLGIIIFCIVHFLFELGSGNHDAVVLAVLFNYFISAWYVKRQIKRDRFTNNPTLSGIAVACVVFLIRVLLGLVYSMVLLS